MENEMKKKDNKKEMKINLQKKKSGNVGKK